MKKKTVITIAILLSCPLSFMMYGQQQYSIEQCQEMAQRNYPLIKQYDLIESSKEFSISNANKGYLPQLSLSAKASYQSDVTELPVKIPGIDIKGMRKDQYQAALEVSQVVWDGGNIHARKEVTKASSEVEKQKLDVDMYAINERINQLFLGILLLEEQLRQNGSLQEELQRNYDNVKAYVANGIANQADLDAVKVEQLNAIQKQDEMESSHRAYCEVLAKMINVPSAIGSKMLEKPNTDVLLKKDNTYEIDRPELYLFSAQENQLEAQREVLSAKNLPKLGLFVQGTYGNPGLNMLKDEFAANYVAGVRLSWDFGNLYTRKNESRQIELSQSSVDVQKETFLFNTNLQVTQSNNEIAKIVKLMKHDDEIIMLRNNIRKSAQAKVANGTLTVTEMLREITAEDVAKQNKYLHEIQLLMAIYELKNTTNR